MIDLTQPLPASTRHPKAKKLSVDTVSNIKAARQLGYTQVYCAEHFQVSQGCISQIDRGLVWKDVQAAVPFTREQEMERNRTNNLLNPPQPAATHAHVKITTDKSVLDDVTETTKQYRAAHNSQEG